ncbi:MAG: Protease Do [Candidatus Amesbacteria bacterium GW2011_GWA2_47_11b]|uniref:Protease Do n=2 Tax=Candidatus Amesiibacteriota TaxID=1752730 RepID=A0A0G1UL19_9BACT|nr:MAG: Protease Do [Candidatus Amesbacteria bacterium GW2011_GWA2_47_11b]KKU83242.1 MAG: Protease Do [Candidatus Amesbacteria bacterium GW2011_GWC2_47_8]
MKTLVRLAVAILVIGAVFGGAVGDRIWGYKILDKYWPRLKTQELQNSKTQIVTEENVVIEVAEKVSPSVVTVGIKKTQIFREIDPFDFFGMGRIQQKKVEQDIGTGFILTEDGLVVTNKHVVGDTQATYKIVTKDDKTYEVQKIYRDPANDLAILKVDAKELKPVELGDSSKLKVGQMVIAIGTALGEFRHTVTTGVVSGLGRGITAGSPLEGAVERLDNVIQTDAAINPGNSGGPLLNSSGQVIGVNTAISPEGQNIGFAIPINVIKDAIDNFNKTGQFSRPYLGVRYRIVDQKTALLNEVPQGAYVQEVIKDSPAEKVGVAEGDIIIKPKDIAGEVGKHKVGDKIEVEVWRDGESKTMTVTLEEAK